MLKYMKKVVAIGMTLFISFSTYAADAHDIKELNINNIVLPEGYYSCTRTDCSSVYESYLATKGYNHKKWVERMMVPRGMYLCATDGETCHINVSVVNASQADDSNDDPKHHKLINDYNLAEYASDRESLLIETRDMLIDSGIPISDIGRIGWIYATDEMATPFMVVNLTAGKTNLCEYRTVYDGNLICVSFSTQKELSESGIAEIEKMVKAIRFDTPVNYSVVKQIYRQNQNDKRNAPEKKEGDSDTGFILSTVFVTAAILFSIYETTKRSRMLDKNRRKSKTGKY